jgi:hypothetical protein
MHPDDDQFTELLTQVIADAPGPRPGPRRSPEPPAHRVLWFAVGTALWVLIAILGYVLVWLLLHG